MINSAGLQAQAYSCNCQSAQYTKIEVLYTGNSGVSINTFRDAGKTQALQTYSNVQFGQVLVVDATGQYNGMLATDTYLEIVSGGCTTNCPVTAIPTDCGDNNVGQVYGQFRLVFSSDQSLNSCSICDIGTPWTFGGDVVPDDCNELGTLSPTDLAIITGGTEKMRITKNGLVGIGTSNPTHTLDVNGDVRIQNVQKDNSLNKILVEDANGVVKYRDASSMDVSSTNELITGASLTGNNLNITDAGGTHSVNLSSLNNPGTDDQQLLFIGTTLTIEDGNTVVLSSLIDDADADPTNEWNTGATLTGTDLNITDNGGTITVDLSSLNNSGTDDQNLTGATLTGSNLQIDIENGNSATVDLSSLEESADIAQVASDLQNHVTADGDLSSTNELNTGVTYGGTNLSVTDAGGTLTADLSSLEESADIAQVANDLQNHVTADGDLSSTNELLTGANLTGTDLNITDAGGTITVDLSSLNNSGTDDQNLTGATLTGSNLQIDIENGNSATVDLSALEESADIAQVASDLQNHVTADGDLSSTNELNTSVTYTGTNLNVTDAGGTLTADLSSLEESADIAQVANDLQNHVTADGDLSSTNELNTSATLTGTDLNITDAGGTITVDLSSLNNSGTDDQNLTGATTGSNLQIDIENGNSATVICRLWKNLLTSPRSPATCKTTSPQTAT
ncbi:MAG: hypothetical protein H6581_11565 [Bacteroidia bacterium]|nr:hypothetical protein [Bacteroidia bacterium]